MRALIIFFVISFAIFFGIQWGFNYLVPPYQSIGNAFFESLEKNDFESAYALLSTKYKQQVGFTQFQYFMENSDYRNYHTAQWFDVVMKKDAGSMKGIVSLKSSTNKQLPLGFSFVKEKKHKIRLDLPQNRDKPIGEFSAWKIDKIWYLDSKSQVQS
jgi:hypothetical protein